MAVAVLHAWLYMDALMTRSTLYNGGMVTELKVREVLVFSSFDSRPCKGLTFVLLFTLHMLHRLVMCPDLVLVLQRRVLITTSRSAQGQKLCRFGNRERTRD